MSMFWSLILFMGALMTLGPDNYKTGNVLLFFQNIFRKSEIGQVELETPRRNETSSSEHTRNENGVNEDTGRENSAVPGSDIGDCNAVEESESAIVV
eukprot:TRINITY_DN1781_c0_g1_i1.p2 TRINITY_DN1781_c0_g1~~TRINITY_DN1781_c0_g1_i1.p2  ORF type:complete len:97 (-),score=14.70 TRINITY_DN1781_c0_g1_i1:139-429(-)